MIDFIYNIPTKVYFGKDKENEIGNILKDYNFSKILIVIGGHSVENTGLLRRVLDKIDENNIDYKIYKGVRPNPTIQSCRECLEIAKDYKPELILAIGGGSVIDCAKNVACGYYYDGDSFDFNKHVANVSKALPIGVILTTAAAGSELSNSCVIQDDSINYKSGFNSDLVRPKFVVENPELTYSVNAYQTGVGIVDIMMHTLERYLCKSNGIEPADDFALSVLKNVVAVGFSDLAYEASENAHTENLLTMIKNAPTKYIKTEYTNFSATEDMISYIKDNAIFKFV